MKYNFNGKEITIDDKELDNLMNALDLTLEEAIDTWLSDNDYTENEQAAALTAKAKANRITATIHDAKATEKKERKKREVVRKEDATKENIIKQTAEMLATFAEDVKIENVGKLITFRIGEDEFKFDLIRKRKKKEV